MFVAGKWFAPMMLNEPGRGHRVTGELYDNEGWRLRRIDALESVGIPGNFRTLAWVSPNDGSAPCQAIIYMKAPALAVPAHTECLIDYQDRRFVPPERRPQVSANWP